MSYCILGNLKIQIIYIILISLLYWKWFDSAVMSILSFGLLTLPEFLKYIEGEQHDDRKVPAISADTKTINKKRII